MAKISEFDWLSKWRSRGISLKTRDSSHRWATRKQLLTRTERKALRKFRAKSKRRNVRG